MTVGLDLGGHHFRSLRRQGDCLVARSASAVYAIILDNPARRTLFAERQVPYAEYGTNLILFGDAATEWSQRLSVTAIPLCGGAGLQIDDRVIRQVMTVLIEGLLPIPNSHPDDCCLTLPGGVDALPPAVAEFFAQVVRNFGYRPWLTSPSLAVALSELVDTGLSGLGIHLGVSCCEFSIVRQGRELARFEIARGFGRRHLASLPPTEEAAVEILASHAESLREIFAMAAFELQRRPERKALVAPVTLTVSGEIVASPGFADLIPVCVQQASWPFAIRTVRIAADPAWAVSRGCLIQAELEQLAEQVRRAA